MKSQEKSRGEAILKPWSDRDVPSLPTLSCLSCAKGIEIDMESVPT